MKSSDRGMIQQRCVRLSLKVVSLIKSTSTKTQLLQLHAHLILSSLLSVPSISSSFISRLNQTLTPRDTLYIHKVFICIPHPSASLFTTMIIAFSKSDSPLKGFQLVKQMIRSAKRTSPVTLSAVLKCLLRISSFSGGSQIHAMVFKEAFHVDTLLLTNLMELYATFNRGEDARQLFDEMRERDTIAYNVMISCHLRCNKARDALALFTTMAGDCQPDDVTCLYAIQACSTLGELEFGTKVHEFICRNGYATSRVVNSLVSMYLCCGSVVRAYQAFRSINKRDVVTWTALIIGLAKNGKANEAIAAFDDMRRDGILPEEQTLTGVLSACSHAGYVDLGIKYFEAMQREFNLAPNIHHYGCMVDLLARKGLLQEAWRVIKSMHVNDDATIWRTLLGACRIHGDFHMAARAVERIVELKGEQAGDYVLLMNIHSSFGNQQKVSELRKAMQERVLRTEPGCSSICLNGRVHYFNADEVSHERIKEVYEIVEEINKQLRISGYGSRNTGVSWHGEKLAIGYGVLETPPGTAIKVAKDGRICDDCHCFAETFSAF